jgi:four helix bundle protein
MTLQCYQDYIVWQKAMDLAEAVYLITLKLPKEERFSLSDQLRRAAVSVPSNIAEGQGRKSDKEFCHFLYVSRGSVAEIETQLSLCVRFQYLRREAVYDAMELCKETGKMINSLISKLDKEKSINCSMSRSVK